MSRNRTKGKIKRSNKPFCQVWHELLDSPDYLNLNHPAKTLLFDVMRQYRGNNNGDLCITLSVMKERGWKSNDTLTRAKKELINSGLIIETRQGGRHKCSLFALSFEAVDGCGGKLDVLETLTPPKPLRKNKIGIPSNGAVAA